MKKNVRFGFQRGNSRQLYHPQQPQKDTGDILKKLYPDHTHLETSQTSKIETL